MDNVGYRGAFAPNTDSWLIGWTLFDEYGYIAEMEAMGIAEKEELKGKVYPNPLVDQLTIELVEATDKLLVEVYDISGKVVFSQEYRNITNRLTIDLSSLNSGFHVVNLNANQTAKSFKVFIR